MITKFKKLGTNKLVRGSAIAVIGTNLASFFAYIFHVVFGRILGPAHYSELAAFISITTVFSASFIALGTVVVKFASIENDKGDIFFNWLVKISHKIAIVMLIVVFTAVPFLSKFLTIDLSVM